MCYFCQKFPETLKHIFCDCTVVAPLWKKLSDCIDHMISDTVTTVYPDCNYIFGVDSGSRQDRCITFLFLHVFLKFYIIRCKFQQVKLDFQAFISFVKMKQRIEYRVAERNGKLSSQFLKMDTFICVES